MLRGKRHKALADQLTTVSKLRLNRKIGRLSADVLSDVERVIQVQLGLGHGS